MIIKRKTYSVMQQAITGEYGLFDPKMMTGTAAKVGGGLTVGFWGLSEHMHNKQVKQSAEGMANAIKNEKNITSQLENIAKS